MVDTLVRLIRLSYYTNIVSKVPENYSAIFPPKPEPQPLEEPQQPDGHADQHMADADQAPATAGGASSASAAERKWAAEFVTLVSQAVVHELGTTAKHGLPLTRRAAI